MAKVGLFVPAREPVELPWFDLVLADRDEQSLSRAYLRSPVTSAVLVRFCRK